jgi:glycerol uptake facilitator-like aquaporin
MISKISGAHVNPAITVANWSMKKIKSVTALGYIVAQFAGAYLALAVMNMFNSDLGQSAVTSADLWPIFAAEALGAFVLAFGWAASSSKKNKMTDLEKGVLVGGSLFLGITLASFVTGAGNLNPAIVWATSTWDVQLTKVLPALVLGPVLGAAIGMNLYAFLNDEVKFESKKTLDKLKNSGEYIKNRFSKVSEDN